MIESEFDHNPCSAIHSYSSQVLQAIKAVGCVIYLAMYSAHVMLTMQVDNAKLYNLLSMLIAIDSNYEAKEMCAILSR